MIRRYGSKDKNHREIVRGLEAAGRSVLEIWDLSPMNQRRKGAPDILVGWGGHALLMEIKNPHTHWPVTEDQRVWHAWWKGPRVIVVLTLEEALAATGIVNIHKAVGNTQFAGDAGKSVLDGNGADTTGTEGAHENARPPERRRGRRSRTR